MPVVYEATSVVVTIMTLVWILVRMLLLLALLAAHAAPAARTDVSPAAPAADAAVHQGEGALAALVAGANRAVGGQCYAADYADCSALHACLCLQGTYYIRIPSVVVDF